jgi:cytochrome d ubiquinol oxidase subunit II
MIFQIIWFFVWGGLWAAYFMLDGYDFGTGILHGLIGKDEKEKTLVLNTIGPVWNGNEVWLITAGGATFAAFPTTYALMFSYLYSALLIILFALILRGVALEFRGKGDSARWKRGWDMAILIGNFIPALLFGIAFGNIFKGLPMDSGGYHGSLLTLLNPYGLLTGIFFLLLFLEHGALWIAMKTSDELSERAGRFAKRIWYLVLTAAVLFLLYTKFATSLYRNYLNDIVLFTVPLLAVLFLIGTKFFVTKGHYTRAFLSSSLTIVAVMATSLIGLYPNLIPSSMDSTFSLTIFNSSSSVRTLKIMTLVAVLFVPVVIAYQIWIHRIFRGKTTADEY